MRRECKPEFPVRGIQRRDRARRVAAARRFGLLGLLLASLMLLLVPAAQAHSAEQEARIESKKASREAERAAQKQARAEAIQERKEWPKEANAEWEHGSVQVTCTQIKWDLTGFTAGSTSLLEKVSVDHSQAYLTVSSFNGVSDYVTTNIMESPGRHAIRAYAKWRSNKVNGHFVLHAKLSCPPDPGFSIEDKHEVVGAGGSYTTAPITALLGQSVAYEVIAKNTGNVPLSFGNFVDPRCDAATISHGTSPVAPGASITYNCKHLVTEADQAAGSYMSAASLTGTPPLGDGPPFAHTTNTLATSVPAPAFTIDDLQQLSGASSYTTSPLTAPVGQTIDYEMIVTNTGNVELALGSFTDPSCDEGTISGSTAVVAPGATATIMCSHLVSSSDQASGGYSSIATVTGTPPEGDGPAVTNSSNTLALTVPTVDFSLQALQELPAGSYTSSAVSAGLGEKVSYEVIARNTGTVPLALGALSDTRCDADTLSGGASTLAPGAATTFLCTHVVTAADQTAGSFTSSAMLEGTPPEGDGAAVTHTSNVLTATVPAPARTTTPATGTSPSSGVLGFKSASVPGLVGPKACVRAGFRVSLKSAGLSSVTFYLDGHKLRVLTAKNARNGLITLVINPAKWTTGRHKLLAKITMTQAGKHARRTLVISRCGVSKKG